MGAAASPHHHLSHLISPAFLQVLSGAEVVAAIAFLIRPIELYAGGLLLLIFAVAGVLDISLGEAPVQLLFYAATVIFFFAARQPSVVADGPASGAVHQHAH
jgi:hypothetical protein